MVIQEPESSPLSKLRHYLNLSDDKDVEISLEDEQSLEDVVLADDRERQMRNNEEALSMAIEKSLSPIQKFADFFVAKAWTEGDVQKYHNDLYTHIQEKSPELASKFGDFIGNLGDASPEKQLQLAHKWVEQHDQSAQEDNADLKTPIYDDDVPYPQMGDGEIDLDGFTPLSNNDFDWKVQLRQMADLDQPRALGKQGHIDRTADRRSSSRREAEANNRFHDMLRTKKDNIENIVMSNIDEDERGDAQELFNRLAGEGEEVTQDHRDAAKEIKQRYEGLFEDDDWEVPMSGGGGGSTAQENTEANEAERERQKRDGLRRGEVTHNFKPQGGSKSAKAKWNALKSHYSAGDLSSEDVATDLQNYFEENAPADAQARISSGELDAWAKQFEASKEIPEESSMLDRNGKYKNPRRRATVVPLEPTPRNQDGTPRNQDGDGATGSTNENEEEDDDPFNIPDDDDDPDKNESNDNIEIDTPDGDDGTDYNLNFKGGAANRLMELGLLDADNNPTEAGQKVFNQVSEMAKAAGDIFNSQVISGEDGDGRQGPFSTFITANNANYWGTRENDYASNWSNASMNHFEAAYNHANPEAPLEPVNDFDADGNLVPIDGAEMNDIPDNINLTANHIAGAVAAGRAGNNSELAFAHFLNLSDDLEGSHISGMANRLKEHHEANNIDKGAYRTDGDGGGEGGTGEGEGGDGGEGGTGEGEGGTGDGGASGGGDAPERTISPAVRQHLIDAGLSDEDIQQAIDDNKLHNEDGRRIHINRVRENFPISEGGADGETGEGDGGTGEGEGEGGEGTGGGGSEEGGDGEEGTGEEGSGGGPTSFRTDEVEAERRRLNQGTQSEMDLDSGNGESTNSAGGTPSSETKHDRMRRQLVEAGHYENDQEAADTDDKDVYADHREWRKTQRSNTGDESSSSRKFDREEGLKKIAQHHYGDDWEDHIDDVRDMYDHSDDAAIKGDLDKARASQLNNVGQQTTAARNKIANADKLMANTHARSKELPEEMSPEEATEHAQDIIIAMHADGRHYDEDTLEHVQKQLHDLESAGADMEGIHSHLKDIADKGIEVNSDEHHEEISRQHQEKIDASEKERIDREDRQNQRKEHLEDVHNHPGWNNANVHHEVTKETVGPGGFPSIREQRSKAYANSYDENGKRTQIEHNSQEHQEHGENWSDMGDAQYHSKAPFHPHHTEEQRQAYQAVHDHMHDGHKTHGKDVEALHKHTKAGEAINAKKDKELAKADTLHKERAGDDGEYKSGTIHKRFEDEVRGHRDDYNKRKDEIADKHNKDKDALTKQHDSDYRKQEVGRAKERISLQDAHDKELAPIVAKEEDHHKTMDKHKEDHQAKIRPLMNRRYDAEGDERDSIDNAIAKHNEDHQKIHDEGQETLNSIRDEHAEISTRHGKERTDLRTKHDNHRRSQDGERKREHEELDIATSIANHDAEEDHAAILDQADNEHADRKKEQDDNYANHKEIANRDHESEMSKHGEAGEAIRADKLDQKEHDSKLKELSEAAKGVGVTCEELANPGLGATADGHEEESGDCKPPAGTPVPTDSDGNPMVWRCGKGRNWVKKENFDAGANAAANGNVAIIPEHPEHGGMTLAHGGNMFHVGPTEGGDQAGHEDLLGGALHDIITGANGGDSSWLDGKDDDNPATLPLDAFKAAGIHLDQIGNHPSKDTEGGSGTASRVEDQKYSGAGNWLNRVMGGEKGGAARSMLRNLGNETRGGIRSGRGGENLPSMPKSNVGNALRRARFIRGKLGGTGAAATSRGSEVDASAKREMQRLIPKLFRGRKLNARINAEDQHERNWSRKKIRDIVAQAHKEVTGETEKPEKPKKKGWKYQGEDV